MSEVLWECGDQTLPPSTIDLHKACDCDSCKRNQPEGIAGYLRTTTSDGRGVTIFIYEQEAMSRLSDALNIDLVSALH